MAAVVGNSDKVTSVLTGNDAQGASEKPSKEKPVENDNCYEEQPVQSSQDISIMSKVKSTTSIQLLNVKVSGISVCEEYPNNKKPIDTE